MSVRVLFDVAELGPHGETGAGGVRRVVENVAKGLLDRRDIDVRFTGLSSWGASRCATFLTQGGQRNRFANSKLGLLECLGWAAEGCCAVLPKDRARTRQAAQRLMRPLKNAGRRRSLHISRQALHMADVFHSPFRPLLLQPRSARRCPVFFITIYDLIPITHPSFAGEFFCDAMRKILASITVDTWIICISQFVKDQVCEYLRFPPGRVFVTPLAASSETFRACDRLEIQEVCNRYGIGDGPYILSVGANDARKNVQQLLECFGRVLLGGEVGDLKLVLAGARNFSFDSAAIFGRYPGLSRRVVFTGFIPNEHLAPIYSGATLFAFPSIVEGFGLPVLEAMQCGAPVLSSDASSLPEVVGNAGLLVPATDHDAWCDAILRVVRDDSFRQALRVKSLKRSASFSWEATTSATVHAYKTAVGA